MHLVAMPHVLVHNVKLFGVHCAALSDHCQVQHLERLLGLPTDKVARRGMQKVRAERPVQGF